MANQDTTANTCSVCGEAASARCIACADVRYPNNVSAPTFYCSKNCQTKGWPSHKKACQAVQAHVKLFRAGELLQEAFYATRAEAFDLNITKVEKFSDGTLHFFDAQRPASLPTIGPIPDKFGFDTKTKQAILSWNAGNDVFHSMMLELGRKAFKGYVAKVEEVTVRIFYAKVSTYRHFGSEPDGTFFTTHHLLCVTLKDQSTWAVDIGGAQHGQYHPVLSFDDYSRDYVAKVLQRQLYGTDSERPEKPVCSRHPLDGYDKAVDLAWNTDYQLDELCEWEYHHQPIGAMLKANEADYQASKMQLVNTLATAAREYVKLTKEDPTSKAKPIWRANPWEPPLSKEDQERVDRKDARYMAKFGPDMLQLMEETKVVIARQKESGGLQ